MAGPLDGLRVVELAQGLAGPYCGMLLGDAGARVMKVEPLDGDYARAYGPPFRNGESAQFLEINRNKRGLSLDIDRPEAREVAQRLLHEADVLLTDFGPARATELGLDYAAVERINRRLVHCNVTPFGEHGPMADQPGAELVVQAMAEYTESLGRHGDSPVRLGTDVANINTGGQAVQGIVSALLMRDRTDEGQFVDVNMLRTLMHLRGQIWTAHSEHVDDLGGPHTEGNIVPNGPSGYMNTKPQDHGYRTKDGHVLLQGRGSTPERYQALLEELGIADDVKDDPRWAEPGGIIGGSSMHGWEVKDVWERGLKDRTTQETIDLFESHGMSAFPVNDYEMLFADPQVHEINMVQELTHPTAGTYRTLGSPWLFADTPAAIQGPAPMLGEHTDAVLADAGYSAGEIDGLRQTGVVR